MKSKKQQVVWNRLSNIFDPDLIDPKSIEVENVSMHDYPDFSDAYIYYAEMYGGVPLTEDEYDLLHEVYSEYVYEAVCRDQI